MKFSVLKTNVEVSPLFFAVLTSFLLVDKNRIASAAVLFSALHELGHFLALLCVKSHAKAVKISAFGIEMQLYENMSTVKKIAVLMAGFTVNFVLAFFFFKAGKTLFAYINLVIGCLTGLPVAATDGGSVLKIIFEKIFPEKADKLFFSVSLSLSIFVSAIMVLAAVYSKNYYLLIAAFYIVLSAKK